MMRASEPYRLLVGAAVIYLGAYAVHFADHVSVGLSHTPVAVLLGGTAGGIAGVLALLLARARHPLAPPLAIVTGFPAAVGFAAVHIPPHWGVFSEPFAGASAASWASVAFSMLASVLLGLAGVYALRARARSATAI